jgi:V-type H+-transporting ATPase subunit C
MKDRAQEVNSLKSQYAALARRASGSIAVRNLSDLIEKEDFIESEKLTTLFVLVPKINAKEWAQNYSTFAENVVPHSSRKIVEDDSVILYSAVMFKNSVEKFKQKAR